MSDISALSFEAAMAELEEVVRKLESGQVALEESIVLYQRGADLKAHCDARLRAAEEKVEQIRSREGAAVATTPVEGL